MAEATKTTGNIYNHDYISHDSKGRLRSHEAILQLEALYLLFRADAEEIYSPGKNTSNHSHHDRQEETHRPPNTIINTPIVESTAHLPSPLNPTKEQAEKHPSSIGCMLINEIHLPFILNPTEAQEMHLSSKESMRMPVVESMVLLSSTLNPTTRTSGSNNNDNDDANRNNVHITAPFLSGTTGFRVPQGLFFFDLIEPPPICHPMACYLL